MKKYKLEELQLGMEVNIDELSEIYDTWILLEKQSPEAVEGIVRFIGKRPNKDSQALLDSGIIVGCIYNDSIYLEEDVIFDE